MRKLKNLALLSLLSFLSLAQNPTDFITPEIKRVGMKLACLCGSCKNTVGDCAMIACGYSFPARQKIKQYQSMGASDASIIGRFVKERGKQVLAEPPDEGFHLLSWLVPIFFITLGAMAIWAYWNRFRHPHSVAVAVPAGTPAVDPSVAADYHSQAAKELENLEP